MFIRTSSFAQPEWPGVTASPPDMGGRAKCHAACEALLGGGAAQP